MQDIWVSLHSNRSSSTFFDSFIVDCFNHYRRPLHVTRFSRFCWGSSDTGHHRFETSSRLARLQGLPEVGPARFLAAMLGDLGVSTLCLINTMTQFFLFFEHQTSHAACFNARTLLYKCVSDALLFFFVVPTCWEAHFSSSRYSTYFLFPSFFWIIIPAILPTTMLRYYSMSASLMPSKFFIIVSIYWKPAFYKLSLDLSSFGKTTNRSAAKLTYSFFFWTDVHAIRPVDSSRLRSPGLNRPGVWESTSSAGQYKANEATPCNRTQSQAIYTDNWT
jgi:hypothetical protein